MFNKIKLINNFLNKLTLNGRALQNNVFFLSEHRYIHSSLAFFAVKGIPIKMPSLSPTMTEGTIVKWAMKEGDKISAGDMLCEVQTDKAIVAFEMEDEGILAKIILPDDTKDIKIGTLIALMVEDGQEWRDVEVPDDVQVHAPTVVPQSNAKITETAKDEHKHNQLLGPSVRNLLQQYSIDLNAVQSSGPHNTILKSDVLKYIKTHNLQPETVGTETRQSKHSPKKEKIPIGERKFVDIELNNMRKTIAKRLTQSKTTIPHSYMTIDCNMNSLISLRQKLKKSGSKVSINDFIIKAAGIALKKVPQINSSWDEITSTVKLLSSVDISIAVATPNGLITPIIKNANQLSVDTICNTVKELAEKARNGKLQPHEFQGGSFSISNLGMYGINEFSAVINPPQSAILAIGNSQMVLSESEELLQMMSVTISFDSRAIEEDISAKFLETFKSIIEDPISMENYDGSDNRRLNALLS